MSFKDRMIDLLRDTGERRSVIKYPEPEICPICHGECVVPGNHGVDEMCEECDGEGVIYE